MSEIGLSKRETVQWAAETFGVSIERDEADRLRTLRDLHDLVLARLAEAMPAAEDRRCLSSHAFYRLRRALVEVCGVERRQVRPDAVLRELLPREHRRRAWRQLHERSGLPLPGTEPAITMVLAMFLVGPAVALAGAGVMRLTGQPAAFVGLAVLGFLLIPPFPLGVWLAARLAPALPAGTVRELVRLTFVRGYGRVAREADACNEREVEAAIYAMVIEASGLAWVDGKDEIGLDDTFEEWGLR